MKLEPDFKKFWLGTSVSIFGSTITEFALPLTAAQILNASPTQMGALAAVQWLPTLLLGLFVGVWVDQRRRKPVMMTSDLLRGITLSAVPIATLLGQLNMTVLLIVAVLHGIFSVLELVAYPAYLPTLVGREHITEANSRINLSMSSAQVMGPSLAGVLAQIISAPFTIAFDALSFVFSAACLSAIRKPEPLPEYVAHRACQLS